MGGPRHEAGTHRGRTCGRPLTPRAPSERAVLRALRLRRAPAPQGAEAHARLIHARTWGRRGRVVVKHVDAGGMLARLGEAMGERLLRALPREGSVVLSPIERRGRVLHRLRGELFLVFPWTRTTEGPHPFAAWRANTSSFVRFHVALRADLAEASALCAATPFSPHALWLDTGSDDWPWERTRGVLGEDRARWCEVLLWEPERHDAAGHRDVVARNVAYSDEATVVFDLDELGPATAWQDVLTSAAWAGFDRTALTFVLDRLRGEVGRKIERFDVASALRLVLRRLSDELAQNGDAPLPDGYLEGHHRRVDQLLGLSERC